MKPETSLNRYLEAQARLRKKEKPGVPPARPFVTISREAGAGGRSIANKVADILNKQPQGAPWTVFDKNIVEIVLKEHDLPERMSQYMTESAVSSVKDYVGELLGLHPATDTLVKKTNSTIVALAKMGNAVIVGRGGNCLTRGLESGFHVRLVAPLDARSERIQEFRNVDQKESMELVKRIDEDRKKYVREYFEEDIDDALAYHCVLNTFLLSYSGTAELIANRVLSL
jgi:cytidylate kinase